MVAVGDTVCVPVVEATVPIFWSIETVVAPVTSQCKIVDPPVDILLVPAVKLLMVGGELAALLTLTMAGALIEPALLVAVRV